ncbi:protein-methionine-sulfoxide reductase catalytic subunit MsrP [Pigmentiphaga litoralis]|uniref:Protein-methionine-sulfoxide reductase catalytic subunit MsrP n=1 Tax=Pigmentiphaga litoralis TaxID=516702 RepID=A0A7Y9LQH8_9BURK|nr:protein-methionine-sulfoxide reductase catalytic subunit MsrP [Pigmentiphaga litoralis]NYE27011.1 sulfoxide reductase catalytic subunit YedY [Pigmentiphaga litoralis]NYE86128.1 sulfoxide reductase catalytic subunit YedY [Pigmentiphaga litoralis]
MLIRRPGDIAPSEITAQSVYQDRRRLMLQAGAAAAAMGLAGWTNRQAFAQTTTGEKLVATRNPQFVVMDKLTPVKDVTTYNNFYEFGTDKGDPADNAGRFKTKPWTVAIEGEVKKPMTIGLDDLRKMAPMEERVYRLRCVEGWSMVIPWVGFSLSELIKRVEPTGNAKFVEFVTATQPETMPGLRSRVLEWPYVEALRMDEAMHPLALLTFGVYGETLPNQNGAPVRIVAPWKYGFKSGKSLVKIRFVEKQPVTSWIKAASSEYGFYANVNPDVPHPRWSQATERRIGEDGLFSPKRKTLPFNGYADQVASLYAGMDLKKNY